jgi:hypothetical protein
MAATAAAPRVPRAKSGAASSSSKRRRTATLGSRLTVRACGVVQHPAPGCEPIWRGDLDELAARSRRGELLLMKGTVVFAAPLQVRARARGPVMASVKGERKALDDYRRAGREEREAEAAARGRTGAGGVGAEAEPGWVGGGGRPRAGAGPRDGPPRCPGHRGGPHRSRGAAGRTRRWCVVWGRDARAPV